MAGSSVDKRNPYVRRLEQLKQERSTWLSHWKDLSEYLDPRGLRYVGSDRNNGSKKGEKIINNTAVLALRALCAGLMGGLTNPQQVWFKLAIADRRTASRKRVKVFLEDCAEVMAAVFAKSNVYAEIQKAYKHLAAYGTAAILLEEDDEELLRATLLPIGQYCLATDAKGRVDTCYREFAMTVAQLVDTYGIDNVTQSTREMYNTGNYDQWIDVIHVIEPRRGRDRNDKTAKGMPFRSLVMEKGAGSGEFLRESGYNEFPVLCPRWEATGEDVYGESPGMLCLGDIKELQALEARKLEAFAKQVNPPLVLYGDVKSPKVSVQPGAITRVSQTAGDNAFRPLYQVTPDAQGVSMEIEKVELRIKRAFFEDLLLIVSQLDNVRTATDIIERKNEKMVLLGPVVQSLEQELLTPLISRSFRILEERGAFAEPPEELVDADSDGTKVIRQALRPTYESPFASQQKSQSTGHVEAFFQLVGPILGVAPETAMRINWDELVKEVAAKTGITVQAVRDDEETAALKQGAAQQQQAAAASEQLVSGAQAAKLLSDARFEPNSALGALSAQAGMMAPAG